MKARKSRGFMKNQRDDEEWNRAISEPRLAICDIHASGIGIRRLQIIVCPSFDPHQAWEVRQCENEWFLFRSEVVSDGGGSAFGRSWAGFSTSGSRTINSLP